MAQPHSRDVRAQPRPHVALSPKGILLSLPHHTQITNRQRNTHNREYRVKERREERQEEERKEETAEKHLLKALILFCDKFRTNLKNTPEKQENASKMTEKRP